MRWEFWVWLVAWAAFGRLVWIYGLGSPWWESKMGRSLLPMKVALFLLFTWVLSVFIWPGYPGSDVLRVVCLSFVTFMALWQGRVWRNVQKHGPDNSDPVDKDFRL